MGKDLVFTEEFLAVLDETDEDHDGRAGKADEEHDLEDAHPEQSDGEHEAIVAEYSENA
jgi:hypothetical protein